jgi:hypothetical protein
MAEREKYTTKEADIDLQTEQRALAATVYRIISRAYGPVDAILNIEILQNMGLIVTFKDDGNTVQMKIGDTIKYGFVKEPKRLDSIYKVLEDVDPYLIGTTNGFVRLDAAKPRNCKKGLSCKGACIDPNEECDVPDIRAVATKQEIGRLNGAAIAIKKLQLSDGEESTEPDKYESLNIRELKVEASKRDVNRYSYMTTEQLRESLRVLDKDPDQQERLRKSLQNQKDVAALKKVKTTRIGRAIAQVNPVLGRQFNILTALGKRFGDDKLEASILAVAVLAGVTGAVAKEADKAYRGNLAQSATDAEAIAKQELQEVRDGGKPSKLFVVGSYNDGSQDLLNKLGEANISKDDGNWLNRQADLIPFLRDKEGTQRSSNPVERFGEDVFTGWKAVMDPIFQQGSNPEAVRLAAEMYAQGAKKSSNGDFPDIRVLAHGDGGFIARQAMDILGRMQDVTGGGRNSGVKGSDMLKRAKMVSLSTPTFDLFGQSSSKAPEISIMGDGDFWSGLPFQKSEAATRRVGGVRGNNSRDYTNSSGAMDEIMKHLR